MPTFEVTICFPDCSFDVHESFLEGQLTNLHSRLHAFSRRDEDGTALIFRVDTAGPSEAATRARQTATGIFTNQRLQVESIQEVGYESRN